jgi:small subunit ribosomal protein S9
MSQQSPYGTGKRKNAIARVWVTPGAGNITVNGKPVEEYFPRIALQQLVREPFSKTTVGFNFDVKATAKGGGTSGQAWAVRHGIAKALLEQDGELRTELRGLGALTRDPRVKERKKYGHKRARRGFQFSKR